MISCRGGVYSNKMGVLTYLPKYSKTILFKCNVYRSSFYYYYYYTGEDYSDTVTSNAAGALYKIKLDT